MTCETNSEFADIELQVSHTRKIKIKGTLNK